MCESITIRCSPEEGQLLPIHPGAQCQTGILSKWRDDHGEDESNEDKTGREDDLRTVSSGGGGGEKCLCSNVYVILLL